MSGHRLRYPLCAAAIVAVCVLGVLIAVDLNPLQFLDTAVHNWVTAHRDHAVHRAVAALTDLFSPPVITLLTALCAALLTWRDRNALRGLVVIVSVIIGAGICEALKLAIDRPGPPWIQEHVMSYPSGHVVGTSTFLLVTAVVALTGPARRVAVIVAVLITVVAALTRLYLDVHWTTDVIAAAMIGAATAWSVPALVDQHLDRLHRRLPPRWRRYLTRRNTAAASILETAV